MSQGPTDWVPEAQLALDGLVEALQRVDLDALLASEGRLSDVAARLARVRQTPTRIDPAARQQLETLERTLARCRRLGASLSDVVRIAHAAHGGVVDADVYGQDGSPRPAAATGAFQTQV